MQSGIVLRFTIGCIALAAFLPYCISFGATLTVPDDFPTIKAAVEAASPDDTVYVKSGYYYENVILMKPLHLRGADRTSTHLIAKDASKNAVYILLLSGEVTVEDLTISGADCGISILKTGTGKVTIRHTCIVDNTRGVEAFGDASVEIVDSLFTSNDCGITLWRDTRASISGNEIGWGDVGASIADVSDVSLYDNLIVSKVPLYVYDSGTAPGGYDPRTDFGGAIEGSGNRLFGFEHDLLPPRDTQLWPDTFVVPGFAAAVSPIIDAYLYASDLREAGEPEGAEERYTEALSLCETLCTLYGVNAFFLIGEIHFNLGQLQAEMEDYQAAVLNFEQAISAYNALSMRRVVAAAAKKLGLAFGHLDDHGSALNAFYLALEVYEQEFTLLEAADLYNNIGMTLVYLSRLQEALEFLNNRALPIYLFLGLTEQAGGTHLNIGLAYYLAGQYLAALDEWRRAKYTFLAESEIPTELLAAACANIASLYEVIGEEEWALEEYDYAKRVYEGLNREEQAALMAMNLGRVKDGLGLHDEASEEFEEALTFFRSRGMLGKVASVLSLIASGKQERGEYAEALNLDFEALSTIDAILPAEGMPYSCPDTRWILLRDIGRCYEALTEWKNAKESYEEAIRVVESVRHYLTAEGMKLSWQMRTARVYQLLIDLLVRLGQGESAFAYAERCRARTFLDMLYQGGVGPDQLVSNEAGFTAGAIDPSEIEIALQSASRILADNEMVLEYMTTGAGIYVWTVTSEGIGEPRFVAYPRDELMSDVIALRQSLEAPDAAISSLIDSLRLFYERLVQPALRELDETVDTLILIPSGPLWYLPFSALVMADREKVEESGLGSRYPYLIERYTIAYLPSLASLPSLMREERATGLEGSCFVLANPTLSEPQVAELGVTDYQYEQLEAACEAFIHCYGADEERFYVKEWAKERRAYEQKGGPQVVVYAAHGMFNPYVPLESKLFLAPGGDPLAQDVRVPDGNYHAWEAILTDYRGTNLVILAACETLLPALREAKGLLGAVLGADPEAVELSCEKLQEITVGDEVVGLARAFLSAGADAVLETLWQVNPDAVEALLVSLCKHYREGASWAQALTDAQCELIADKRFSNPWFFASFQLIGTWR